MKIMIASDLHGSAYYCNKLMESYKEENAKKLLLLGDLLYHGPRNDLPKEYDPKKVIKMLNSKKNEILSVRGNCEAEADQMVLDFPVLADYCILCLGNRMLYATHGHKLNPENLPPLNKGDILMNGHTHVPKCTGYGKDGQIDYIYMNPGSVSIPKENSPHSYMILEDNKFTWKDFEGNSFMEYNIKDL